MGEMSQSIRNSLLKKKEISIEVACQNLGHVSYNLLSIKKIYKFL